MAKERVLFVCNDGARSQMAAAILLKYADERFEVGCAAIAPAMMGPHMARALQEHGVEPLSVWLYPLTSMRGKFRYLIALDESIELPASLGGACRCWHVEDPSATASLKAFEEARDQLEGLIFDWLNRFEERFEPEQTVPPHHLVDNPINVQRSA